MKYTSILVSALLSALLLTACGEKAEEAPAAESAPQAAPAPAAEPAPAPAPAAGGYEPTAEERVPGITMTPEELAGSAPAAEAPAEAAPAEAPAEGS